VACWKTDKIKDSLSSAVHRVNPMKTPRILQLRNTFSRRTIGIGCHTSTVVR
jgi:hypothetical protein